MKFLLEKGADPDPRDSFYNTTPLGWALGAGHQGIAVLLVRHGASDVDAALPAAVRSSQKELVRAILEQGPLHAYQRTAALELARSAHNDEIADLLEAAEVKPLAPVEVDGETLRRYAGRYRIANGERVIEVYEKDGALAVREEGRDDFELAAVSDGPHVVDRHFHVFSSRLHHVDQAVLGRAPAISDGALFVRTRTHLYALGETRAP